MPANLENSAVPQEWKRSVFIQIPKKGSVREHANFSTFALISHTSKVMLKALQEGRPLPGPKSGLLSNTQKWIVWGNKCADKANDFIGKGAWVESSRYGNSGELLCHSLLFSGDGISFWVVFSQSFWLSTANCTYQEHCQWLNNKGICHLPLWRLKTMLL